MTIFATMLRLHMLRVRLSVLAALLFFQSLCFGQVTSLSGLVSGPDGIGLPGVTIQLVEDDRGTVSDHLGRFIFRDVKLDTCTIKASFIGFQQHRQVYVIKDSRPRNIKISLKEEVAQLSEVTVTGKSEISELKESVAAVAVLETKSLYTQSNNTSDVIKQIAGVNVRQTGGYGSQSEIYINGMSGKQVKFFLDGIPLSYFGSGLGLNVFPVNLMQRIEVYKGVVPIDLGADALGGAINIVSRKEYANYLDAAYSVGSFNTHKINLNGQYVHADQHFFAGINSFYNHSDNNYKIDVEIPDRYGNPVPSTVRRFHDQFTNFLWNTYVGVYDKTYADRLVLSAKFSGTEDDIQHNAIMSQPYGQATSDQYTLGFSTNYEKAEILPGMDLKWYGGGNITRGNFVDTTLRAYTWDGQVFDRRTDGGEISTSRNLLQLYSENVVSRFNIRQSPWEKGTFTLNVFSSWFSRTGKDSIAADFYGEDFFTYPTTLIKNALGLAYEHSLSDNINSYTGFKYYHLKADGYAIQNMEFQSNRQNVSNFGVSQSFRYRFARNFIAKASYEYATRLPDEIELFGDFMLVRPNPFLNPERSHNANVGLQFNTPKLKVGLNTFYRLTENIIWLRTSQFFAQYQNLLKALVRGLDLEIQYHPAEILKLKFNATYQDLRNRSPRNVTGSVDERYFDARLPNIPYLFGNGEIRYIKEKFLGTENRFSAWWSASFVHEYYLYWASDGNKDLKNTIPTQLIQNAGISCAVPNDRISVSVESNNVLDKEAYDNFSVQRPGRAFYLTIRMYLYQK